MEGDEKSELGTASPRSGALSPQLARPAASRLSGEQIYVAFICQATLTLTHTPHHGFGRNAICLSRQDLPESTCDLQRCLFGYKQKLRPLQTSNASSTPWRPCFSVLTEQNAYLQNARWRNRDRQAPSKKFVGSGSGSSGVRAYLVQGNNVPPNVVEYVTVVA